MVERFWVYERKTLDYPSLTFCDIPLSHGVHLNNALFLTYVLKDSEDCELLGINEVMLSPSLS